MTDPRVPSAEELKQIEQAGFRPGASPGWWLAANGEPVTTDDALKAIAWVKQAYPNDPRAGKAGWRTSEFWVTVSVVVPVVSTGIAAMAGAFTTLPAPWNAVAGGVLAGVGAAAAALYARSRSELKKAGMEP